MIECADSVNVAALPAGYGAYLGYVDGQYANYGQIRLKFPGVPVIGLTVLGGFQPADGCDIEKFDLTPASGAAWCRGRIRAGQLLPICYASVGAMPQVMHELAVLGISRAEVRVLTAHYQAGFHICGPHTCGDLSFDADGTQWAADQPSPAGGLIDLSVLTPGFFGPPPAAGWQETMMRALPTVKQGATGPDVRSVQGLCAARQHPVAVDGIFGPATESAVKRVQQDARVAVDGIVGPVTWQKLMAV